jgi:hypothetical protein
MSVVQRVFPAPGSEWGLFNIKEVPITSSYDAFSQRMRLSYPGGMRKASRDLETFLKLSKEAEPSSCEIIVSWTSHY